MKSDTFKPSQTYDLYITVPPDGGYSWVIATISFIGFIIADGIGSCFYLYRDRIAQDLEISTPMSAIIGSTYSSLCLFAGPIVSSMCNLYGFRWLLIVGGILTSTGLGLAYFSKSFSVMLLFFGVTAGVGGGCALIPITAPVGYWFDNKRPIAIGASSAGSGIGMLLVPYTTNIIMELYGWKWAFIYHSALFSLYIVLGIFLISLPPVLLKAEESSADRPVRKLGGDVHPKRLKAHDKYHRPAAEIFPPSLIQIPASDQRIYASMSRNIGKMDGRSESYYHKILSRPTITSDKLQSSQTVIMRICTCCKKQELGNRPMYKTDLFYHGSVYRIHKRENLQVEKAIDYAMSVSKLPTKVDILEEAALCVCYPEAIRRTLNTMFDFTIMKEYCFLLFLFSNFFFTMGSCLPVLYISNKAQSKKHFARDMLNLLVPSIGIGIFFGRLTAGIFLQLFPFIHAFHICVTVNFVVALFTFGITYFEAVFFFFIYTSSFGMFFGIFTSLRSLILVDYLGLERLTTATGISFAFGGLALLLGPPLADYLKQLCECTNSIFYFAGGLMILSLILLSTMPTVKKSTLRWK